MLQFKKLSHCILTLRYGSLIQFLKNQETATCMKNVVLCELVKNIL